jgi:hypothetical protein
MIAIEQKGLSVENYYSRNMDGQINFAYPITETTN